MIGNHFFGLKGRDNISLPSECSEEMFVRLYISINL